MRRLLAAAVQANGSLAAILHDLGVSRRVLSQRLSVLRSEGFAVRAFLWDPRRLGRPLESVVLLRAARYDAASLADLETQIRADPVITTAVRVTGGFDYRLVCFHADARSASAWLRSMEALPLVQEARLQFVDTRWGDNLSGLKVESPVLRG
jgi:DNA-binding Lrp family transcriptional regulator